MSIQEEVEPINQKKEENQNQKLIIQNIKLEMEFKESLLTDEKLFLCEKYKHSTGPNQLIFDICSCGEIVCEACKNYCHEDCSIRDKKKNKKGKKPKIFDDSNFIVTEYLSSCECNHKETKIKDENIKNLKFIPCFFSKFLCKFFENETFLYQCDNSLRCKFCYENCVENKNSYQYSNKFHLDRIDCNCQNHKNHLFDKVIDYMRNSYNSQNDYESKNIDFDEIYSKFKIQFNEWQESLKNPSIYEDIQKHEYSEYSGFTMSRSFQESIIKKFAIFTIIFNPNIVLDKMYEKNMFDFSLEKLSEKDPLYFNYERKNSILSYIFYYYKKYLFNNFNLVTGKLINMITFEQRIQIFSVNEQIIIKKNLNEMLSIDVIEMMFNYFKLLRFYSIKTSDDKPNTPFNVYFLKLFFQVYSYEKGDLEKLSKILKDVRFKYKDEFFNNLIKKNIDEIYYILKIHEIDKYLSSNIGILNQDSGSDAFDKKNKILSKILDFSVSEGDKFRSYLNLISKNEFKDSDNSLLKDDFIKNIKNDDLIYLDCFHNKFISELFGFILNDTRKFKLNLNNSEANISSKIFNKNNDKNFQIDEDENNKDENKKFKKKLKNILRLMGLEDLEKFSKISSEFLNFLFHKLEQYYEELNYLEMNFSMHDITLLEGLYSFDIELNDFLITIENKNHNLEIKDFTRKKIILQDIVFGEYHKKDLEYIFKFVFYKESYKQISFISYQHLFNLVLFALVCNKKNIRYLLTEIKFFDYLFFIKRANDGKNSKKSFLIRSLFKTKPSIKDFNFIWKIFYLIYDHYLCNNYEFDYFLDDIVKFYVREIIEYYMINHKKIMNAKQINQNYISDSREKLLNDMNVPLIFYFFKIVKKLLIKTNFSQVFYFDYNVNNYTLINNLYYLNDLIMDKHLDINAYFKGFEIMHSSFKEILKFDDIEKKIKLILPNEIKENDKKINELKEFLLKKYYRKNYDEINENKQNLIKDTLKISVLNNLNIQHLIVSVLDLSGHIHIKHDVNIDLKFFENPQKNNNIIKEFLINKETISNEKIKDYFKLEKIFIKYLTNLLKLKICNHLSIDYIVNSNLTDDDLIHLGKMNGSEKLVKVLNFRLNNNSSENTHVVISKYIFNKMKIKAIEILKEYLLDKNISYKKIKQDININNSILVNLTYLLKDYLIMKNEGIKFNVYYEQNFKELFTKFEIFLEKNFPIKKSELITNINSDNHNIDIIYLKIYNQIYQIFSDKNFSIIKYDSFYGSEDSVMLYYFEFFDDDMKKNNNISKIMEDLFFSLFINDQKSLENKEKLLKEKNNNQNLANQYWVNIKEKLVLAKDEIKIDVLEKMIENFIYQLKSLDRIENYKIILYFDEIFTENFLKTLNFLVNCLFYFGDQIGQRIIEKMEVNHFQILLKKIIQLNNFIIYDSEYETHKRSYSISKVYCLFMDFFNLLGEGNDNCKNVKFMFSQLNLNSDNEQITNHLDIVEDFLNNSTELDDKFKEFKKEIEDIDCQKIHTELNKLIKKYQKDFFRKTEKIEFNDDLDEVENKFDKLDLNLNPFLIIFEKLSDCLKKLENQEKKDKYEEYEKSISIECDDDFNEDEEEEDYDKYEHSKISYNNNESIEVDTKIENFDTNLNEEKIYVDITEKFEENKISDDVKKDKNPVNINTKLFEFNIISMIDFIIEKINEFQSLYIKTSYQQNGDSFEIKSKLFKKEKNEKTVFSLICYLYDMLFEYLVKFSEELMNKNLSLEDFNEFLLVNKILIEKITNEGDGFSNFVNFIKIIKSGYQSFLKKNEESNNRNQKVNNEKQVGNNLEKKDIQQIEQDPEKQNLKKYKKHLFMITGEKQENFFYFNFVQLKKIITILTTSNFKNYCCGSDKLILQFLYITRFIKANIQISASNSHEIKIIDFCMREIFDFNWIFLKNCRKEEFSLIIRNMCLKILIAYLEEREGNPKLQFKDKAHQEINLYDLMDIIIDCFEKYLPIEIDKDKLTLEQLIFNYVKDENKIYNNIECEVAELYYRLLRIVSKLYKELIDEFTGDTFESRDKKPFVYEFGENTNRIVNLDSKYFDKKKIKQKKISEITFRNRKNSREKYFLYMKFLLIIGKEIQVNFNDENLYDDEVSRRTLYFFKSPRCFWMTNIMKLNLLETAPRTSLGAKLDFFNKNLDKFLLCISLSYKERIIKYDSVFIAIFYKNFDIKYFNIINFCFVLVTNIMLLYYFYIDSSVALEGDLNSQMYIYSGHPNTDIYGLTKVKYNMIFFQTLFFSFLQILLIFFWYLFRFNILYWLNYYEDEENHYYLFEKNKTEDDFQTSSFVDHSVIKEKYTNEGKFLLNYDHHVSIQLRIGIKSLFLNSKMFSISMCFFLNILFLSTNYKLFLVIQILSVINMYSLFEYFLEAIFNKYKQFVSLLIFIYCVEYIFSWISFLYLQEFMMTDYMRRDGDLNQEGGTELFCSTAIECFLNYVDLGLRLGGGIGDVTPRVSYKFDTSKNYYTKILFDVVFHIVVNLILANIFFGVIVDAFNEMRNQKDKKENDQTDKCYICNLDRYDGSKGENFEKHRNMKHNIFNYVFVIPYLIRKNFKDYSRAELFVWERISIQKLDWYPADKDKIEEKEKSKQKEK